MKNKTVIISRSAMPPKATEKLATWNSRTTYALGLYRILTRILGIWPPDCDKVLPKIRVGILVFLQISMLISLIGEVISENSGINDVVEVISLLSCAVLTLIKVLILRYFRPKMLDLITSAVEDWTAVDSPDARKIMMNHARIGRRVCIFQMTSAYTTAIPIIFGALPFFGSAINATGTNENEIANRSLPLGTIGLFGDMPDYVYGIVFAAQAIQLFATCTGNIGNDVYFFGITMHLCGQFQVLSEDLKNFEIEVDEFGHRKKFIGLVERHVRLGVLAKHLEDCFNFIILAQLVANALQMSMMGIQMILSLKLGDTVGVVNTFIVIYVLGLELFLYSYAGDRLSSQMEHLRVSAYFLPWYDLPPRLAKDVLIMIMRNHRSFSITAGKIYRMDIENFKNFIKGLGSYFSVLRIMIDA